MTDHAWLQSAGRIRIKEGINMKVISIEGLKFITRQEGEVLKPYASIEGGLPTIGVGHKITPGEYHSGKIIINGEPVRYAGGLTRDQVQDLLAQDLQRFVTAVNDLVDVPLTQGQFDCLVDFAFNCGEGALAQSTLLRLLNQGRYGAVPEQLRRWVHGGGRIIGALVRRREEEIKELWFRKEA